MFIFLVFFYTFCFLLSTHFLSPTLVNFAQTIEMTLDFLQSLITQLAAYEREHGTPTNMQVFATWLLQNNTMMVNAGSINKDTPPPIATGPDTIEAAISKLLFFMVRYAKGYAKKALKGTGLKSLDEYIYLVCLLNNPMTKSELIHYNRHEKPTGMEVIRRLLEMGLVYQLDDITDGRRKVIHLTNNGWNLAIQLIDRIRNLSVVVCGNLDKEEKFNLFTALQKLEKFHEVLLYNNSFEEFDEIFETVKNL